MIATARMFLAISGLIAIHFDATEPTRYSTLVYRLMVLYALFSVLILLVVRARSKVSERLRLGTHATDVLWGAALTLFSQGPNSPFFVFLAFVFTESRLP